MSTATLWGLLQQTKSAAFTRDGGLLWYNQALWGGPASLEVLAGHRWQEFLYPRDRKRGLHWARTAEDGAVIDFQMMGPRSGRMRQVSLAAVGRVAGVLVGIGEFHPLRALHFASFGDLGAVLRLLHL